MDPGQHAKPEPRPDRRGLVSVARDIVLLRRGPAKKTRDAMAIELEELWELLIPLLGDVSLGELIKTKGTFGSYCVAAALRRVRQRQILVVAYGVAVVVVGIPTIWLITRAFDSARTPALAAYLVTMVLLAGPTLWAVRSRHMIATMSVAAVAGALWWKFWPRPPVMAWWDPRTVLALPQTDMQRLSAGVAIGAALVLVLILVGLVSTASLVLVGRSQHGGGSQDVRAFDQFLEVVALLRKTDHRPGDNRRPQIQKTLRTAEVALLVMARGARPIGWVGYWRSRRQHRENVQKIQKIIEEIQRSNPLTGLRQADDRLQRTIVTCLIGICRDQLGEVLITLEEDASSRTASSGDRVRRISAGRRKAEQLCVVGLPMVAILALRHFHILASGLFLNVMLGAAALVLVFGPFVILFPGLHVFLNRLGQVISAVSAAMPILKGEAGKEWNPAPGQRSPFESSSADPVDASDEKV